MVGAKTLLRWGELLFAVTFVVVEYVIREFITRIFRPVENVLQIFGLSSPSTPTKPTEEELDMERTAIELIEARGYHAEEHFVTTPDGYILGMQRIPYNQNCADGADEVFESQPKEPLRVVLIMHGFMQSSEAYLARKNTYNSLPFLCADAGYDVWLGNNRGNKYSLKHTTKNAANEDFWNYSLDEMVRYDLPTMIQYVLDITGASSLTLVGFSQGTAQSMGLLGSNHALASKINLFVALAPVSTPRGFSNSIIDNLIRTRPDFIFLLFGRKQILHCTLFWRKFLSREGFVKLMDTSVAFLFNWTCKCIDEAEKKLLYSYIYSHASVKCAVHWLQIIQTNRFQMFDDSLVCHADGTYSSSCMPIYRPGQIPCPVAIFYGGKDNLPNTPALLASLPKDKVVLIHKEDEYEHLDFMWAKDVGKKVYSQILTLMKTYNVPQKKTPRSHMVRKEGGAYVRVERDGGAYLKKDIFVSAKNLNECSAS